MRLRLSARQSALAQTQAFQVGSELTRHHPDMEVEYHFRESLGDKNLTDPLWKMPEKGVFTEDFFKDLTENKTDLVVHSWKDLPTESKKQTFIAVTLPRADQRDLLLFKKSSRRKGRLRLFSSSPRRAHNLKSFFQWALPWAHEDLEFSSVRGNIPTRIQKLLEADDVDGLILAKAAWDRLSESSHFPDTQKFLHQALQKLDWMVLPLCENPNAAAQGALAIEVSTQRPEILEWLKALQCQSSFQSCQREREILKEFGGGCHLALGMSVLERPYGRIEIVKGLTPAGDSISSQKFYPSRKRPAGQTLGRLQFASRRTSKAVSYENLQALFVAKAEALPLTGNLGDMLIWTAGLRTWKKLAERGLWVHGSSEGLGEHENPRIENLAGRDIKWGRVTHDQAPTSDDKVTLGAYTLELFLESTTLDEAQAYFWKSGSEFLLAAQRFPEIKKRFHICGPGRTYDIILAHLEKEGLGQNIFVELSDEFVTVI